MHFPIFFSDPAEDGKFCPGKKLMFLQKANNLLCKRAPRNLHYLERQLGCSARSPDTVTSPPGERHALST